MCTGGVGNLLARDRAAAAAAAAVLLVRALDGLASFFALAALLVLAEVDAPGVLGPGRRVILVELPEHPEVGQHLLLVLRDRRVPEVDVEEE